MVYLHLTLAIVYFYLSGRVPFHISKTEQKGEIGEKGPKVVIFEVSKDGPN